MNKSKTGAQTIVDDIGLSLRSSSLATASLFRPSSTYRFNEHDEYATIGSFGRKNATEEQLKEQRAEALNEAFDMILDPTYGSAKAYVASNYITREFNQEVPVFVSYTETKSFIIRSRNTAIEDYLRRTADFWKTSPDSNSSWAPCVLIRPILRKPADALAVGYLLCPAEVTTDTDAWVRAGFRKPGLRTPISPTPVEDYLQRFFTADGRFSVPVALSSATPGEFTYYWAAFAAGDFPDDLPPRPAVPQLPYNFEGMMAQNVNIAFGGSANQDVSDFVPPSFDAPLTAEQLKYVRGGGRPHYGDHSVAEPNNKLAAAIGTAAAAMITVGVATALAS